VTRTDPAGEYPEGIAWLAGGGLAGMLLVVSWMDDCVHLVDAATGRRLATIATGANPRGFGEMIWHRP
jgi:YVTN family beta-propeller protein